LAVLRQGGRHLVEGAVDRRAQILGRRPIGMARGGRRPRQGGYEQQRERTNDEANGSHVFSSRGQRACDFSPSPIAFCRSTALTLSSWRLLPREPPGQARPLV